jgi:uncharacterized protein YacL
MNIIRVLLIIVCGVCGWLLALNSFASINAAALGAAVGMAAAAFAIIVEVRIKTMHLKTLLCGTAGAIAGLIIANLFTYAFSFFQSDKTSVAVLLCVLINAIFFYVGLTVGLKKGTELDTSRWPIPGMKQTGSANFKLLDTSVIIDGRIADICETGFIEGILVIPQFILRELTSIADSSDSLKRTRGRRGLDILKKIQKQTSIEVRIIEQDFPKIKEVDAKLVALAKDMEAKIMTNDFNLNKVAEIQGVSVLNINQLATSVKPLVLPGEIMKVYIQREGKEPGQGVAYLDDGTMVVVENGKRYQGRELEVAVTSVLQTTSGRMIFAMVKGDNPGALFQPPQHHRV